MPRTVQNIQQEPVQDRVLAACALHHHRTGLGFDPDLGKRLDWCTVHEWTVNPDVKEHTCRVKSLTHEHSQSLGHEVGESMMRRFCISISPDVSQKLRTTQVWMKATRDTEVYR